MKRFALLVLFGLMNNAHAEISVVDDDGLTVRLSAPARRIVSLAPHVTEVLYAAGAGNRLVGVVEYSDYPEAAKKLPRIGGYSRLDLEAIAALKPDLVIAWKSGNAAASVEKLKGLGIPVYITQPDHIEDIARDMERYGKLAGTEAVANGEVERFRERYNRIKARYSQRPPVNVFYQIWKEPLMTVNGRQIISDALSLCGGRNVFASLPTLAPKVTVESVIAANPEVIIASGMGSSRPEWLDDWKRWTSISAVKADNLFFVPPELVQRHTPRILEGTEMLCTQLETARGKRR